jgi:hypothetical protein
MNDSNITLHIERLTLDGVPLAHSQRPLVQAAVEAELARLLANDGLAAELHSGGTLRHIPGGNIQLSSNGNPYTLGQQIAQAVYSGIGTKPSGGKPQ